MDNTKPVPLSTSLVVKKGSNIPITMKKEKIYLNRELVKKLGIVFTSKVIEQSTFIEELNKL